MTEITVTGCGDCPMRNSMGFKDEPHCNLGKFYLNDDHVCGYSIPRNCLIQGNTLTIKLQSNEQDTDTTGN